MSTLSTSAPSLQPEWLQLIRDRIESLRFGALQITVHNGRVTQIESTEKIRVGLLPVESSRRGGDR